MTVQDLQQLFYLEKMIQRDRQRLEDLRSTLDLRSPILSDMPRAPGAKDRIGEVVPKIVDEEAEIEQRICQYTEMKERLTEFISKAPNARLRLILSLRYLDQKSWQQVADEIGGKETEYSVKHACYRYVYGGAEPVRQIAGQVSMFD